MQKTYPSKKKCDVTKKNYNFIFVSRSIFLFFSPLCAYFFAIFHVCCKKDINNTNMVLIFKMICG